MAALERARLRMANLGDEMALCFDDEIICEGSDAEDSPLAKAERHRRREAIELRYLAGHAPLIMSAQLRGPFDKNSGWVNPWRSKRPTQTQPTNRATVTEHANLTHKTASVVSLGKRSRNDSNSSSAVGMRIKALSECSSTSMDIVNNRQPDRPQLYSGFKRFAPNQAGRPTDFANLNERENILQKPSVGIKRRADTNWLKGADVGKRPRNSWSDPTSPTPKERARDISIGKDASSTPMSNVNNAKFNRQLPAETASLSEFEDIPISTADSVHSKRTAAQRRGDDTPDATTRISENKRHRISMGPDSESRNPSICGRESTNSERPHVELLSNGSSEDEGGSYPAMEIGRTAPEYSVNGSSFAEPESSFRHKSVQSCASAPSFEPSPVHTLSRSQLDQEILHGLSQASQLARSAERLTPLKPGDAKLNAVERGSSQLARRDDLSFTTEKTPSQIASASLNHASQTRSQSHPLPISPMGVTILKPKRNGRSRSFDSPLPPGSLKYRRVRRKVPTPVKGKQNSDTSEAIEKQNTLEAGPLLSTRVQDDTDGKDVVSPNSRDLNQVTPQFPISGSGLQPSNLVPIIEVTDNDEVENSKSQPLHRDSEDRLPTRTSIPPISPAATKKGANELENGQESCPKQLIDGHGSQSSFDAPAIRPEEKTDSEEVPAGQQASESQPRMEPDAEEPSNGGVENRENERSFTTDSFIAEEPNIEDDTLSQDLPSQLAAPELTDKESTLGQITQPHAAKGPNSKSSPLPPLPSMPDAVDDDQVSEASFTSAAEESNLKPAPVPAVVDGDQASAASFTSAPEEVDSLPVPQSPWAVEEVSVPQFVLAEPPVGTRNFSMSQSKDASLLLVETEPHRAAAASSDHNSEPPQSNEVFAGRSISSGLTPTRSILMPPRPLFPRYPSSPRSAKVGHHDLVPLSNPWANNTQSPIVHPRPTKRKKRVSFNPPPVDSDNEDTGDKQPDLQSNVAPESRDLSSPPPPPEAESFTDGDNAFHRKLKWTSGILSRRSSKDRLCSVSRKDAILPGSPGVGAMAEAFLAADARVKSADVNTGEFQDKSAVIDSHSFGSLVEGEKQQDELVTTSAVRAIPLMTESQLVNPWGDEDEAPPFSMAEYGTRDEDDGLVEDVLSDMDAMLGDWNVDAELDRAKREGRGKTGGEMTARERLVGTGY